MGPQELQSRIRVLRSRIEGLQDDNQNYNKNIQDIEAGIDETSSMSRQWENKLFECYGTVSRKLECLSPNSTFRDEYLSRIEAVLSSREAVEISECLASMKSNAAQRINDIEESIRKNKVQIANHELEIESLQRELASTMEMSTE